MEFGYKTIEIVARTWIKAMGHRISLSGVDSIPKQGGAVIATNHIGYLDFVFIGYAAREQKRWVRFMAKKEVWKHPVARPIMNSLKHIPVDRYGAPQEAFDIAVAKLRAGEIVGMFPESTVSRTFVPKRAKTGTVRMAQTAGVPLIPSAVWGTQRIITKGRPPNLKQRKIAIEVRFGQPRIVPPDADPRAVTDEVMQEIGRLLEEAQRDYPQKPRGDDDRWWLPAHLGGTAPNEEASPGPA